MVRPPDQKTTVTEKTVYYSLQPSGSASGSVRRQKEQEKERVATFPAVSGERTRCCSSRRVRTAWYELFQWALVLTTTSVTLKRRYVECKDLYQKKSIYSMSLFIENFREGKLIYSD